MNKKKKRIILFVVVGISLLLILYLVFLWSNSYRLEKIAKKYYDMAIEDYGGYNNEFEIVDGDYSSYMFDDVEYYKLVNLEEIVRKYKSEYLPNYLVGNKIIQNGDAYFIPAWGGNNTGRVISYNIVYLSNENNIYKFRVFTTYCADAELESLVDCGNVLKDVNMFSIKKNGKDWLISYFKFPEFEEID